MDTKELVTVEVVPHSGAIIVTGLLRDGHGAYFHSVTYYGYSQGESVELFIDRHGNELVTD
jgi:hypothetical protein